MILRPRPVTKADFAPLARLWHDGWHKAHAAYVPTDLTKLRTIADFETRVPPLADAMRVIGAPGAPDGLCAVRADELYQIYVTQSAQGTGIANALMRDGEERIAAAGHQTAWLIVVPENARARAFYSRRGWDEAGLTDAALDTATGTYDISLLKMTKSLNLLNG